MNLYSKYFFSSFCFQICNKRIVGFPASTAIHSSFLLDRINFITLLWKWAIFTSTGRIHLFLAIPACTLAMKDPTAKFSSTAYALNYNTVHRKPCWTVKDTSYCESLPSLSLFLFFRIVFFSSKCSLLLSLRVE